MYYLVIIQNAEYDNPTQAVYRYENMDDALAMYHSELAYRHENRKQTACAILDHNGFGIKVDAWAKETETTAEK